MHLEEKFSLINVKIIPKASQSQIVSFENDLLKIRINAIAEKQKANKALIFFLSKKLKIAKSNISIVKGETSQTKVLKIEGLSLNEIQQKILNDL